MAGTDDSIFPLLRAIRAGAGPVLSNADQRSILVAAWVERLQGHPLFSDRVAQGERILARYAEKGAAQRLRATEQNT